nr:hypothetical protein [Tanacetum cinerariifolium]
MGFVHVSLSDYDKKMVNDVNVEIHGVKFKANFVVLDYVNEGEPSILFGRDFLATTKSQVDFGLGEIRLNVNKFKEGIDVINLWRKLEAQEKKLEEIPLISTIPPQPIYHPLTPKQKEKIKEVLYIKYKELEELKPILEVLENYVMYKKKLDENLIGKERLNKKEFSEEDKVGIIEHGLPKKTCGPKNIVLPVKINGVVEMVALVDTEASVCVLPYRGMLCIDDEVIRHTYFPKLQSKSYVEAFEMEGEDDWLGSFQVGRDEDGNMKYDFLGSLSVQLKILDCGNEGYGTYKKVDGDGNWHARFEIVMPSGRKFNQAFKTMITTRKLSGKFKTEDVSRVASRERCQKQDLWMMSTLEESRGLNLAWIIADHLYKHTPGTKENSVICTGHYVTRIAFFLGYCMDDEIKKCLKSIDYEYWISNMLADELDIENTCLKKETKMPTQAEEGSREPRQEHGGLNSSNQSNQGGSYELGGDDYFMSAMPDFIGSSSGYAVGGSFRGAGFNDDDDIDE